MLPWIILYLLAGLAGIVVIGVLLVLICRFLMSCGILSGPGEGLGPADEVHESHAWPPPPREE